MQKLNRLTEKEREVVEKIIERTKSDSSVLAVALFGSSARGEPYNDIDICIFLNPAKYESSYLSKKYLNYTYENEKYDIEIFQHLPMYIRERILKDAKIIYCKDEDLLYELYYQTIRELGHYRPIYEEYLEEVING